MRHRMFTAFQVCLLSLILPALGCNAETKPGSVSPITPREAEGMLRNDFAVQVDVREEKEIAEGMAARALWFPTSKISDTSPEWKAFVAKLPRDKEIVLYCRSGNRSGKVADLLAKQGFKTRNMGAFDEWVAAGLPTRKP